MSRMSADSRIPPTGPHCQAIPPGGAELPEMIESCRAYLLAIAQAALDPGLSVKVGASDLVQETFLAAHRDAVDFRGRSRDELKTWLRGILLHLAANTRRRYRDTDRRRIGLEIPLTPRAEILEDPATPVLGKIASAERTEALRQAVAGLPEMQRRMVEWHHRDGLRFAEIGERLGISENAARKLWRRCLARLRVAMGDEP